MIQTNIHDAQTNLAYFVKMALRGKRVIIAERDKPMVELTPLKEGKGKRVLGQSKGKIILTDAFFEPLPDDFVDSFTNPK